MKTAFAYLDQHIAPVFDTAQLIHVIEVESGRIVGETLETLERDLPLQKTRHLAELGVNTLVCGAVSRPLQVMVAACGIKLIPFVAGELKEVIQAWLNGRLHEEIFSMPGCCRHGRKKTIAHNFKEGTNMNGKGRGGMGSGGGPRPGGGGMSDAGRGRAGQGRGRRGGLQTGGVLGTCLCPKCGHREEHVRGVPCLQRSCPQCGTGMIRE